jgi:hypothetical protein
LKLSAARFGDDRVPYAAARAGKRSQGPVPTLPRASGKGTLDPFCPTCYATQQMSTNFTFVTPALLGCIAVLLLGFAGGSPKKSANAATEDRSMAKTLGSAEPIRAGSTRPRTRSAALPVGGRKPTGGR